MVRVGASWEPRLTGVVSTTEFLAIAPLAVITMAVIQASNALAIGGIAHVVTAVNIFVAANGNGVAVLVNVVGANVRRARIVVVAEIRWIARCRRGCGRRRRG